MTTSRNVDFLEPPKTGTLKLSDRVLTKYGLGTIVVINEAFTVVLHDTWDKGHNCPMLIAGEIVKFEGNRCYLFDTRAANDGEVTCIHA